MDDTTSPAAGNGWRELREQRGLTILDLSDLTGLNRATLEKLELGGSVTESTRRFVRVALRNPEALKESIA